MDMNVDKVEELDDETKVLDKKLNIICEKIKQLNEIKAEMQYILTYKNSDELYNILNFQNDQQKYYPYYKVHPKNQNLEN